LRGLLFFQRPARKNGPERVSHLGKSTCAFNDVMQGFISADSVGPWPLHLPVKSHNTRHGIIHQGWDLYIVVPDSFMEAGLTAVKSMRLGR
jgi:hypothetical protein